MRKQKRYFGRVRAGSCCWKDGVCQHPGRGILDVPCLCPAVISAVRKTPGFKHYLAYRTAVARSTGREDFSTDWRRRCDLGANGTQILRVRWWRSDKDQTSYQVCNSSAGRSTLFVLCEIHPLSVRHKQRCPRWKFKFGADDSGFRGFPEDRSEPWRPQSEPRAAKSKPVGSPPFSKCRCIAACQLVPCRSWVINRASGCCRARQL